MSEEEKNQFLNIWGNDLHTSIPLPDRITSEYLLQSVFKESEKSCTCFVSARKDGRLFILKCSYVSSQNTALQEYNMLKYLSSLNTPPGIFIPSFMDYFEEDGVACLIRDYLYGYSFRDFVENFPDDQLTETQLKTCALQICDALDFLHSQNPPVIHRDIKPDNVIIDQHGSFRLIDFGIARLYRKDGVSDTVNMGSECFAAPEQFGYSQTDARTDIYSLGALLLYGATCEYDIEKLEYSGISNEMKKIIRKCMQFAPKDRYQSSSELRQDLEKLGRDSLEKDKKRWFLRGSLFGAGLTAALFLSVFLLSASAGLSFDGLPSKKVKSLTSVNGSDEKSGQTQSEDDRNLSAASDVLSEAEEGTAASEKLSSSEESAVTSAKLSSSEESAVTSAKLSSSEESTAVSAKTQDSDEIYTFKEPLIERAARVCLNKEEGEPVTARDLRGIVFIGLYENKILSDFNEARYSNGTPYISPDDIFDPDNILPNKLSTLEDLAAMPNLRELSLCNISLDSLEGLSRLHLTSLALVGTGLSDFEEVSTQTDLENLIIMPKEGNQHFDLPFLPELEKLSSLNICNILFDNGYDFLIRMPALQNLTVSSFPDDFIKALKKTNVRNLILWYSHVMDPMPPLTRLSGCVSLEEVSIWGDFSSLFLDDESPSNLPKLRVLALSGYYYRDFECLSSLENLEKLVFSGESADECMLDCQNLDKLPSLKQIYCNQKIRKMLEEYYPERTFKLISD